MECGVYNVGHEEMSSNKYLPDTLIQSEFLFLCTSMYYFEIKNLVKKF